MQLKNKLISCKLNKKDLIIQLKKQNFSRNIIEAFQQVNRENYIMSNSFNYNTQAEIGKGEKSPKPYAIAVMLMLAGIQDNQKILEVGAGSGYVLDLLAHLAPNGEIMGVERIKELADKANERLRIHKNVEIIPGDHKSVKGGLFDRIIVSASCDEIPKNLLKQLKFKGILVVPVGEKIVVVRKESGENKIQEHPGFSFTPLVK